MCLPKESTILENPLVPNGTAPLCRGAARVLKYLAIENSFEQLPAFARRGARRAGWLRSGRTVCREGMDAENGKFRMNRMP